MKASFTQWNRCCKGFLAFFLGALGYLNADDWRIAIEQAERLHSEGRLAEARRTLLNVLPQAGQHKDGTRRLAYTLDNLGSIAQDERQFLDAERFYRRSIALWHDGGAVSEAGLARTMNNLASLLHDLGKLIESHELLRKSESIQLESNDPEIAVTLINLGSNYFQRRKYKEAEETYRRARQILQSTGVPGELDLARVANDLGFVCERTGRKYEAQSHFAVAQRIWEKRVQAGDANPQILIGLTALYLAQRQERQAISLLEDRLTAGRFESGAMVDMLSLYAKALRRSGRKAEAALTEKRRADLRARSQEPLAKHTIAFRGLREEKRKK